jgi:hypothetical protein
MGAAVGGAANEGDGMNDRNWIAALTGVGFLVLAIASVALGGGEPPDPTEDPVEEIVEFYVDNDSNIWIGSLLQGFATASLVFFAGYLRNVLRAAEGAGHTLSAVVLAGATILATGLAIDATLNLTLVETAEDLEPGAVQALAALWHNDFMPMAVGGFIFILAAGLSIVRHGALPAWLGWVAIVIALGTLTPAGFIAFLLAALWIAVVSVMLTMRARRGDEAQPATPPAAA